MPQFRKILAVVVFVVWLATLLPVWPLVSAELNPWAYAFIWANEHFLPVGAVVLGYGFWAFRSGKKDWKASPGAGEVPDPNPTRPKPALMPGRWPERAEPRPNLHKED